MFYDIGDVKGLSEPGKVWIDTYVASTANFSRLRCEIATGRNRMNRAVASLQSHLRLTMPTTTQWTRVIVLHPPESQGVMHEWLQRECEARDWFAVAQYDPYLALAELAMRQRSESARASWGLGRLEHTALVVLEPHQWLAAGANLTELIEAVRAHLPESSIWEAVGDELTLLYEAPPAEAPNRARPPVMNLQPLVKVDQRTTNNPHLAADAHQQGDSGMEDAASTRITRQEIDMLLGDHHPAAESEAS